MDHLALLLVELGLISGVLALLSWLSKRLRVSAIPLVLAIGGPLIAKYSDSIAERLRPSNPAILPRPR
jgi:Kef-type K+ transport system membrane component KefB